MRPAKYLPIPSFLLGLIVASLSLLVRPLWFDISEFLGTSLPVMPAVIILSVLLMAYGIKLYQWMRADNHVSIWHIVTVGILDIFMLGLLYIFFTELGSEKIMIWRNLYRTLPYILWFGGAAWMIWSPPRNRFGRAAVIVLLTLAAIVWAWLPFRTEFTSRPVAYYQQDGMNIIWGSNMRSVSRVEYGRDKNLEFSRQEQSNGLKVTGDQLQRVFIPIPAWRGNLFFRASMDGVRNIYPIHAIKAGHAQSELQQVHIPAPGEAVSFAAFSDIHEQHGNLKKMAEWIPWKQLDFIVQLGDLVNHVADARQVEKSIIAFPTGGLDLPRVFVRGNHETRGESARSLAEWMLPPGGSYYYTFEAGDAFFIVLDSGEDKPDDHAEYSGLVDFTSYNLQQAAWLETILASPEFKMAQHHIVLVHRPPNTPVAQQFAPVMAQLTIRDDIQVVISGDSHTPGIFPGNETGLPFTIANCGGSEVDDMAAVLVNLNAAGIELKIIGLDGRIQESAVIEK